MKVAIVTYELLPQDGTSARTIGFMRALVSRGHEVIVVGPTARNKIDASLVKSIGAEYSGSLPFACRPGMARSFAFALNLVQTLRTIRKNFDFDIMHFANYNMNSLAFPFVRSSLNRPIVSDLHALASTMVLEPGLQSQPLIFHLMNILYQNMMLKFSDSIITPTEELKSLFAQYYSGKIFAVPNCIWLPKGDFQRVSNEVEKKDEWMVFFHANFIHVGERSIREVNRVAEVLERVRARGFQIRLWIAGPGSDIVPDKGPMVRNLGYVRNPNDYLSRCDLVILPVRDLTLGLHSRLVEALAAGKPVIASKEACCGIVPYLHDSGIQVCESLEQMVESVCLLLSQRDKMIEAGKRNAVLANRLFSPEVVGKSLEHAYSETLNAFSKT
ncbi:MAG TPA: glycosyltransferase family 4 protein [Candidatus Bathyarchaeia archaeon]|nr:glycosyltransferase family 4 protein [Candidatus Bathyarchaeia archaeon]